VDVVSRVCRGCGPSSEERLVVGVPQALQLVSGVSIRSLVIDVLLTVDYVELYYVGLRGQEDGYGILCSRVIEKSAVVVSVEERDSRQMRWEGARPTRYFHFA
jgi:hypothetical protein